MVKRCEKRLETLFFLNNFCLIEKALSLQLGRNWGFSHGCRGSIRHFLKLLQLTAVVEVRKNSWHNWHLEPVKVVGLNVRNSSRTT